MSYPAHLELVRAGFGYVIARLGAYRGFIDVDSNNGSLSRDLLLSIGYSQQL